MPGSSRPSGICAPPARGREPVAEKPRYYSKVAEERLAFDQAAKLDRLKYTVEQARQAPIYKDRLDGVTITSLEDLRSLPLTYKKDLKENPPEVWRAVPLEKVWHYHESFGTTGSPVVGWYSLDDIECEVDVIQRWLPEFGPGQTIMNRYPYSFPVPAQLVETAARLMGGAVVPASNLVYNVGFTRVLELINKLNVNVLTSMPLEAVLLKEAALEHGMDPLKDFPTMEAFSFAGRILTPSWQATMEDDWGCTVHNLYGCTEGGPFATSGDDGHLRLHDEAFLFEILDPETKEPIAVRDDHPVIGTLVATTLMREAQPMVRYWTDDLVKAWRDEDGNRCIQVLGRAGGLKQFGGVEVSDFDLEEEILSWSREFGSNVFFVVITHKGFLVRVEAREPGRVNAGEGSRRLSDRLGVPVKVEVVPRGVLVNHVSLITSPQVFKPRTVSDHRVEDRRVINLSGGLINFWADFTPALIARFLLKSVKDWATGVRFKLLE